MLRCDSYQCVRIKPSFFHTWAYPTTKNSVTTKWGMRRQNGLVIDMTCSTQSDSTQETEFPHWKSFHTIINESLPIPIRGQSIPAIRGHLRMKSSTGIIILMIMWTTSTKPTTPSKLYLGRKRCSRRLLLVEFTFLEVGWWHFFLQICVSHFRMATCAFMFGGIKFFEIVPSSSPRGPSHTPKHHFFSVPVCVTPSATYTALSYQRASRSLKAKGWIGRLQCIMHGRQDQQSVTEGLHSSVGSHGCAAGRPNPAVLFWKTIDARLLVDADYFVVHGWMAWRLRGLCMAVPVVRLKAETFGLTPMSFARSMWATTERNGSDWNKHVPAKVLGSRWFRCFFATILAARRQFALRLAELSGTGRVPSYIPLTPLRRAVSPLTSHWRTSDDALIDLTTSRNRMRTCSSRLWCVQQTWKQQHKADYVVTTITMSAPGVSQLINRSVLLIHIEGSSALCTNGEIISLRPKRNHTKFVIDNVFSRLEHFDNRQISKYVVCRLTRI